jgi:hypothetical protein
MVEVDEETGMREENGGSYFGFAVLVVVRPCPLSQPSPPTPGCAAVCGTLEPAKAPERLPRVASTGASAWPPTTAGLAAALHGAGAGRAEGLALGAGLVAALR